MKRNIVIATITAVALIGGGTATAIAVAGDDEAPAKKTVSVSNDEHDRDDVNDVNDDADDTARDRAEDKAEDKADAAEDQAARDTDQDADDKAENAAEAKAGQVTAAEAIRTALKHKDGTAVSADLDDEGTNLVWDVDVLTGGDKWFSVQVDPRTGKVLGSHADRDDDGDDAAETRQVRAALKGSSVTAAEAAEAAAAKGTVTSLDLDEEGVNKAWEAETTAADGTGSDWRVDLNSGALTADRTDD